MADRGGRNEMSGRAGAAAQVRTVHGGLHVQAPSVVGVALVFAVVGLALVAMVRPPEAAPPPATAVSVGAVEPDWDVVEVPKDENTKAVALAEAESLVRRVWPAEAEVRNVRSSRIAGGLWLRADVATPGDRCAGVVESMVIDLGDVYSVLVITAQR